MELEPKVERGGFDEMPKMAIDGTCIDKTILHFQSYTYPLKSRLRRNMIEVENGEKTVY